MTKGIRQTLCPVTGLREAAESIYVLTFESAEIAASVRPGQFLNIRVADGTDPLLRRPFSVYRVDGNSVEILFNVIGRGTAAIRKKRAGDLLDVLGPLGKPFTVDSPDYATAVLVGGGLGVAPLPLTTRALRAAGKSIVTLIGSRTSRGVVSAHLENVNIATDDGSMGFHGTVVDLARSMLRPNPYPAPKIFGCGPTPMLRALAEFALSTGIPCEVSLEGPMACGIGICQGCPVELKDGEKKYALMCTDGPTFDVRKVKL